MSWTGFLLKVRSSFWYLPSIYGAVAFVFALISLKIDSYVINIEELYQLLPTILLTDINLAQIILSSIAASLLTMTTITFSTILVVLTTYLSEFSPRTLQDFITDHSTQRVLGIFVGGFVYSIILLLLLKDDGDGTLFVVPSIAILLSITCLFVFVFFIHHVSSWIQVSNLIHNITWKTTEQIEKDLVSKSDVHEDAPWDDWESEEIKYSTPKEYYAEHTGYIQYIDISAMVEQASKDDCIIKIEKKINDYVDSETKLLSIWSFSENSVKNDYEKYISIGPKLAPMNNIESGLIKIVEIALRALSSGINDPNTAINCINNLGRILTKLGHTHLPRAFHNDKNRNLRVIQDKLEFSDYLYKCFYQIRQSGFHDISVLSSGIQALTFIAANNKEPIKDSVWNFTKYIIEGIDGKSLLSLDKQYINRQLETLAAAAGRKDEFKQI